MEDSRLRAQQDPTAEDYRAAEAALRIMRPDITEGCEEYKSRVQTLAKRRADLGGDRFELVYLLREPSNPMERADVEAWAGIITREERRAVYRANDPAPKVLSAFLDAWQRQLEYYGAMMQAIIRIATDQRRDPLSRDGEEEVGRYARALKQKWPFWSEELEQVFQFLTEVRLELNGNPVSLGKDSAESAHWLATLVIERATEMWWSCKRTAERSQTQPEYLYPASATALFYQCMIEDGSLPRANDLAALLRLERVAAERTLAKRMAGTSSSPVQVQQSQNSELVNAAAPQEETRLFMEAGMQFDKGTGGLDAAPADNTGDRNMTHLEALKRLRDELDAWGDFEESETSREYFPEAIENDKVPGGAPHLLWRAIVTLQGFYPKNRLPKLIGVLDAWANLCKYSRQHGSEDRITQRDKAVEAAKTLREWVCSEEGRLEAEQKPTGERGKRFRVALSFPGEHRNFVGQVAESLAGTFGKNRVLYDRYHEAEFSRLNLDTYLQDLYHDESELNVVFLCNEYNEKEWCGLEWRAIRDLAKQRKDAEIMFFRFDNARIPGLFSIDGYIDITNRSPTDAASLVLERLKRNDQ